MLMLLDLILFCFMDEHAFVHVVKIVVNPLDMSRLSLDRLGWLEIRDR
jgi:hypothetical protein